jgi:nicotinate phosphoribosyltransferase
MFHTFEIIRRVTKPMSYFDHKRLSNAVFNLDAQRMRRGWYTDKYFVNIYKMLSELAILKEEYHGNPDHLREIPSGAHIFPGDMEVEMQWFTRHPGRTVVVGVDKALAILKACTGYWENDKFIETADELEVWAVEDGAIVTYSGDPMNVQPVIRVRGRYRDFAILETPTLGILTRASRVATNVYETLIAAQGKPVLFFPARFDLHEVQAADGYAYNIAVQRFNLDYAGKLGPFVSTDAQGDWWGGAGGGTVAHSAIACFLGDTAEAMLAFARMIDPNIARIALVDFNNNCVLDSIQTCKAMFFEYKKHVEAGDEEEAKRFILRGVRLDTSATLRDSSLELLGDPALDLGVNPRLVQSVRRALDSAWKEWDLPATWVQKVEEYCRGVKIVVSGGFNVEKITHFERLKAPVDIYAVGSAFFDNHGLTVMDFTADIVKVKIAGQWVDMAKVGRAACDNPDLERVW